MSRNAILMLALLFCVVWAVCVGWSASEAIMLMRSSPVTQTVSEAPQ